MIHKNYSEFKLSSIIAYPYRKTKAESDIKAVYFSAPTDELIIRHVVRETVFEDEDLLLFDQNDIEPLIEQWDCVHRDDRKWFSSNSTKKIPIKLHLVKSIFEN